MAESSPNFIEATLVPAQGKRLKMQWLLVPVAVVAIYSMIIPLVIMDLWISLYQAIYFTAMGIPKLRKRDYVVMERWDLRKLSLWQKINCVYCEYANGILAYAKAIGNQTEIYSCAIKHRHALKEHEHEREYYSARKFE